MRHVPVQGEEEPGEDEWKIIAAGTDINAVSAEKEVNQWYSEKGMGVSMLQNQTTLGIQSPIKLYARAAERRLLFRFSRLLAKNCSA